MESAEAIQTGGKQPGGTTGRGVGGGRAAEVVEKLEIESKVTKKGNK